MRLELIFVMALTVGLLVPQIAMAQQNGYRITVNVVAHGFGKDRVGIDVTTENGYSASQEVYTAGGAAWTFNIPPNQGSTIQVCVGQGLIGANCQRFTVSGGDISVNMGAAGIG